MRRVIPYRRDRQLRLLFAQLQRILLPSWGALAVVRYMLAICIQGSLQRSLILIYLTILTLIRRGECSAQYRAQRHRP